MIDKPHEILRNVRKQHGLTQRELARRANISSPYLNQIESGDRKISQTPAIRRICQALNLRYDRLIVKPVSQEWVEAAFEVAAVTDPLFRRGLEMNLPWDLKAFALEMIGWLKP